MRRLIEQAAALLALVILSPVFLLISILIVLDSPGHVLYRQKRVGKDDRDFTIYKFRTMRRNAEGEGLLTTGRSDERVTRSGKFLRHYKLDELPQLFNILRGDMCFVGPRPEVRKYVELYSPEQRRVLTVKPGLTDYASLEYLQEGDILAGAEDPEKLYLREIMPAKLELNLKYINERGIWKDLHIILRTLGQILRG
jgi:lipopolysaccharide/colanic/teichoic acid biosynthesis glycosyltransferase